VQVAVSPSAFAFAVMMAVPALFAVTTPVLLTEAIAELLVDQVAGSSE